MPLIVIGPYPQSFGQLVEAYYEDPDVQLIECNNSFEAIPQIRKLGGGVLVCYAPDTKVGLNLLALFKATRNFIRRGSLRILMTTKVESSDYLKKTRSFGVKDILHEPVSARQLEFKVRNMLSRTRRQLEEVREKIQEMQEEKKRKKGAAKRGSIADSMQHKNGRWGKKKKDHVTIKSGGDGSQADSVVFVDPLKLQSDCWLLRGGNKRKVMGRWMVTLVGPANISAGRWNDATEDSSGKVWRWVPSKPNEDPFIKEQGEWLFKGHKPDFKNDRWTFVGKAPELGFYYDGKMYGAKINFKDKKLVLAKDSRAAIEKIPHIIASIENRVKEAKSFGIQSEEEKEAEKKESKVANYLKEQYAIMQDGEKEGKDYGNNIGDDPAVAEWNNQMDDPFLNDEDEKLEKENGKKKTQNKSEDNIFKEDTENKKEANDYQDRKEEKKSKELEATQEGMGPGKEHEATQEGVGGSGKELEATQEGMGPGKEMEATQEGTGPGSELGGTFSQEQNEAAWNDKQGNEERSKDPSSLPPEVEGLPVYRYPYDHFGGDGEWEFVSDGAEGKKWYVFVSAEIDSGIIQEPEKLPRFYTYYGLAQPNASDDGSEWLFRGERPKTYQKFEKLPNHVQAYLKKRVSGGDVLGSPQIEGQGDDPGPIYDHEGGASPENRTEDGEATQEGQKEGKELEASTDQGKPPEEKSAETEEADSSNGADASQESEDETSPPIEYRDGKPVDPADKKDDTETSNSEEKDPPADSAEATAEKLKKKLAEKESTPEGSQEAIEAAQKELAKKSRPEALLEPDSEKDPAEQSAEAPQLVGAKGPPGPSLSPLAIGFLLSELMGRVETESHYIIKRFCDYLAASCGGLRVDVYCGDKDNRQVVSSSVGEEPEKDFASELLKGLDLSGSEAQLIKDKDEKQFLVAPVPGANGVVLISGDGVEGVEIDYVNAVSGMLKGAVLGYERSSSSNDGLVSKDHGSEAA